MAKASIKNVAGRRIFVSYCHADYRHAQRLNMALRAIPGDTVIFLDVGGGERLMAGDAWQEKIQQALESANVFIVLMSMDFQASEFCREVELRRMLVRRSSEPDAVKVIGIPLHSVRLKDFSVEVSGRTLSLEDYQCVPQEVSAGPTGRRLGLKPINKWRDERDAWVKAVEQIEEALRSGQAPMFAAPDRPSPEVPQATAPMLPSISAAHLPYLCDRDDQYYELLSALESWRTQGFSRPLVLVTEGRGDDCLGKWVDRLRQHDISKSLGFEQMGLSFGHFKPFSWPAASTALVASADARQRFVRALAAALSPDPLASEPKVFEAHLIRARPTLLWVDCADTFTVEHARRGLEGLLAVLAACPALSQRTMLVVAINLVREPTATPNERARLAEEFKPLLDRATESGEVHAAMLGSLPEVDESAINTWSAHDLVSGKLIDEIEMLCTKLPAGRNSWTMRSFAETARQWFRSA